MPLDTAFSYRVPDGMAPAVGGRVLVPFRQQRMSGIVVNLHDREPSVVTKNVVSVLDSAPVLDEQLMRLGKWIADYYLAPLGEVFRTMLPLSAEFRRTILYRISEQGHMALHLGGMSGSSARARRTPEEQLAEFRVLDYLANREEAVREASLRSATGVSRAVLAGMVRKKWLEREDVSGARDAARTVKVAVLRTEAERAAPAPAGEDLSTGSGQVARQAKLNANQQTLLDALAESNGRADVDALHALDVPRTTLNTLVKRGLVEIVEEPAEFHISRVKARQSPFEFEFNAAQKHALEGIQEGMATRKFSGMLLHGVTGSGKTAVYLAAMRTVLEAGRSAILLVPEIGLTPAVAADLHQVFGDEVAILHSALTDQERAEQWHRIKRGEARMVVGTRSAVFAPVSDLALIIVDEEQDSSYKQEETPRYHARDVAVMRAKMANAVVVLGSATPSLESYYNAKKNKYALHRTARPRGAAPAARSRIDRHAAGISGDRAGAGSLAQAGGRNPRAARAQRTSDDPAEPARLFSSGSVPHLRQDARVQELRHRHDAPQARPQNGMPLLRLHRARTPEMRALRQRVRLFPGNRLGKAGRTPARHVSHRPHRPTGSRHGARQAKTSSAP